VPANLYRPASAEPVDDPAIADESEGRGDAAATAEPRAVKSTRRKRAPVVGETKGRKLSLPDAVFDRLQLLAFQRRTSASAIATEILDRNLPRLRIEREA
jgi:hypothetical protein